MTQKASVRMEEIRRRTRRLRQRRAHRINCTLSAVCLFLTVGIASLLCGVLIYRDARIVEGWPMHQIPFADKKRGDALYFPGHIALYLGEGRYIHSTGASASGGVVINSLDPADPLYREDLVKSLYAVGSVF